MAIKKFEITELEGVEFFDGTPDEKIIGLTKTTIERILLMSDCPADALALYCFYAYVCKWQENACAWATASYSMKKLGWGKVKFYNAKKSLKDLNLITDEIRHDKTTGKVKGHFVRVRYAVSTTEKVHCPEKRQGGFRETESLVVQGYTKKVSLEEQKEDILFNIRDEAKEAFARIKQTLSTTEERG